MKMLTILAQKLLFMVKSRRRINDSFERLETLRFVEFIYIFLACFSIVILSASLIHIMHEPNSQTGEKAGSGGCRVLVSGRLYYDQKRKEDFS